MSDAPPSLERLAKGVEIIEREVSGLREFRHRTGETLQGLLATKTDLDELREHGEGLERRLGLLELWRAGTDGERRVSSKLLAIVGGCAGGLMVTIAGAALRKLGF